MIRITTLMTVLAGPVSADMRVTQAVCEDSWTRVVELVFAPMPDFFAADDADEQQAALEAVNVSMTPDGWCLIKPETEPALADVDLQEASWRADGLEAFINDTGLPSRLEMRLLGTAATTENTAVSYVSVAVQHVPDQGLLLIERLDLGQRTDTPIALTAVVGGAYFRDIGSAMMSFGGLNLQQMAATVDVTPALIAELAPELTAALLETSISDLSFAQLDRPDRRAVLDFAGALPDATGKLTVDFASERGFGFIQLGLAQSREGAEAVSFALSGATVGVDWTPE